MSVAEVNGAWQERRLRDAVTKLVDGSHNPPAKQDSGQPMLSARNVEQGKIIFDDFRFITDAAFVTENARTRVAPGDVLLTIVGTIGRSAVVPQGIAPFALQRSVAVLSPMSDLDSRFLSYQLQSPRIQRHFEAHARGTAQKGVYLKTLGETPLVLPGLDEQLKIVAEIEKQFSRLDEAVANLQRVKANLRRYEVATLQALVCGQAETSGSCERPELPRGWQWKALPELGELSRGKSKHRPRDDPRLYGGPYPFIQTGDVRRSGGRVRESTQTYSDFGLNQSRLWPAGTLCITIAANIAETGILTMPACFPDSVVGFLSYDTTLTRFVEFFMRTARDDLERFAPATAQKNINLAVLERVVVPVPPSGERERIVAEVDRRLSIVREVEAEVDANLMRAQALRHAVLAMSFDAGAATVAGSP